MEEKNIKRRKTHTEESITEAFWKLYAEKSISQITIKELTSKAAIHRSSFYAHYDDIYDLFSKLENELLEGMSEYLAYAISSDNSDPPLDAVLKYYTENIEKICILYGPNGDMNFHEKVMNRLIPVLMEHLQIKKDDKDAEHILMFFAGGSLSFLCTWYLREQSIPSTETIEQIRFAIMNGFGHALESHSDNTAMLNNLLDFKLNSV